jgi:hypothetical protein
MIMVIAAPINKRYMTLQMLNVKGAGVISVGYISEMAFCDIPLKNPKAPRLLISSVATSKANPIIALTN